MVISHSITLLEKFEGFISHCSSQKQKIRLLYTWENLMFSQGEKIQSTSAKTIIFYQHLSPHHPSPLEKRRNENPLTLFDKSSCWHYTAFYFWAHFIVWWRILLYYPVKAHLSMTVLLTWHQVLTVRVGLKWCDHLFKKINSKLFFHFILYQWQKSYRKTWHTNISALTSKKQKM